MHRRQYSDSARQKMAGICMHCGCGCGGRTVMDPSHSLDLQQQIEELRSHLVRSQSHISNMEQDCENKIQTTNNELLKTREELVKLRDRYERLMESHKRLQKINNNLENKLLNMVNTTESEKTNLQKELATMTSKLVEAKSVIVELEEENERARKDCNLAVHLLQCKPNNFMAQRLNSLPIDLRERVKEHLTSEQIVNMENSSSTPETTKLIHVPMQTFPPTAMVYSVPKQNSETTDAKPPPKPSSGIPSVIMAKVLAQPDLKRHQQRIYFCLKCKEDYYFSDKETQTNVQSEKSMRSSIRVHQKVRSQLSNSSTETDNSS